MSPSFNLADLAKTSYVRSWHRLNISTISARPWTCASLDGKNAAKLHQSRMRRSNPNRRLASGRRKPLARYGAMKCALRERIAPQLLHHQWGHDLA